MEQQNFVPGSGKTQCMGCMQFYNAEFDVCPFCGYQKDTPVKAPWHIKPGTLLVGRYVIGRVVGYGGFGVTYIAWDTMLKRRIAIKEYLPSEFATRMADEQEIMLLDGEKQLSQYQKGLDRFLQEGKRLAQVGDISGIVHMYNCFQANGTAYITMEFLDGRTLEEYLAEKGRLTEQETLDLMMPVLEALQSVHEKGIIHRDISPDNIFLTADNEGHLHAKLIDFGASRFATTSHSKSLTVLIRAWLFAGGAVPQQRPAGNVHRCVCRCGLHVSHGHRPAAAGRPGAPLQNRGKEARPSAGARAAESGPVLKFRNGPAQCAECARGGPHRLHIRLPGGTGFL